VDSDQRSPAPERPRHLGEGTLGWITGVFGAGSRITRLRPISEGLWHVNRALVVVDRQGHRHRLILRRWARPGGRSRTPTSPSSGR
jgi:hypothetical protein